MTNAELSRLYLMLIEAPSSVAECAAILDKPPRRVQIGMWQLTSANRACVVGSVPNPSEGRGHKRTLNLYAARITSPTCPPLLRTD